MEESIVIEEKIMKTIRSVITGLPGDFNSDDGLHSLTSVIAERKGFFSRRKLTFTARFRVNEETREVIYNETLVEKKSGLGAGTGEGISGFGFRKWKTASGPGGLEGVLEEQSECSAESTALPSGSSRFGTRSANWLKTRDTPSSTRSGENCRGRKKI